MKKNFLTICLVASYMMLINVSCKKDESYNPKQKISTIEVAQDYLTETLVNGVVQHSESDAVPRFLAERWNWDGNVLKSIIYYDETGDSSEEKFEYEGKQLKAIVTNEGRCELTYSNGKIVSVDYLNKSGNREKVYEMTYEKNKISKISETHFNKSGHNNSLGIRSLLRFILPNGNVEAVNGTLAKLSARGLKGEEHWRDLYFHWNGDNISSVEVDALNGNTFNTTYEYDNNDNPYYRLFDMASLAFTSMFSKNNVTKWSDEYTTTKNVYTYSGSFPQSCKETQVSEFSFGNELYRDTYTTYFYYEYR